MKIINQTTETTPIDAIRPHPRNPRQGDIGAIHQSIQNNGFYGTIIAQRSTGYILAGNHRWQAAQQTQATQVPVTWVDVDDDHALRILLADNRTNDLATYNDHALAEILEGLRKDTGTLSGTGYNDDDLDDLLADLNDNKPKDGLTDPDDVPETPAEPTTKPGDLWILGNHRLLCGDSSDIKAIERLLNGSRPDAVVTDPPYGIGIDGQKESICSNPKHNRKAHAFKGWDAQRPDAEIFNYILSLNVPSLIWGGNYFADLLPATRGWIYWSKGQDGLSMSDGELAWTSQHKVLRSVTVNRNALKGSVHPTQKPTEVIAFSLQYLDAGTVVLDLFGGSGTTLIACEKTNRHCRMMELDPAYCDVIIKRWEDFTGQTAQLQN